MGLGKITHSGVGTVVGDGDELIGCCTGAEGIAKATTAVSTSREQERRRDQATPFPSSLCPEFLY